MKKVEGCYIAQSHQLFYLLHLRDEAVVGGNLVHLLVGVLEPDGSELAGLGLLEGTGHRQRLNINNNEP